MAAEDYLDLYDYDLYLHEYDGRYPSGDYPPRKTCKRCGKGGLKWLNVEGSWWLADDWENLHLCGDEGGKEFSSVPTEDESK